MGPRREDIFFARVLRGVIEGTLERVLMEYIINEGGSRWSPVVSTSSVFERAQADNVNAILLAQNSSLSSEIPEETRARVLDAVAARYLVLAPERSINVRDAPRFAWWRIDPRSGETIAVTDDGLHQALEYSLVQEKENLPVFAVQRNLATGKEARVLVRNLPEFMRIMKELGFRLVPGGYGGLGVAGVREPKAPRPVVREDVTRVRSKALIDRWRILRERFFSRRDLRVRFTLPLRRRPQGQVLRSPHE